MARAPPLPSLLVSIIALIRLQIAASQGSSVTVSSTCSTTYSLLSPGDDIVQNFDNVTDLQRSPAVLAAGTADACCAQCTLSKVCGAWVLASGSCYLKTGSVENLQQALGKNICSGCTRGGIRIIPGQANDADSVPPTSTPTVATSAGKIDLSRYDLYGEIRVYKALSGNVSLQASSLWVAVNSTSGAAWGVAVPYFKAITNKPSSTLSYFGESIWPNSNASGCVTVNATNNASGSGMVLRYADSDSVPFSVCNGTCSKTTPLASGFLYNFAVDNSARNYYNATVTYIAYPTYHPACIASLLSLTRADPVSKFLINQPGTTPVNGSQPVLGSYHYVDAGMRTIVAAFDNITCLKFTADFGSNVTSLTFSLYDDGTVGFALRKTTGRDSSRPLQTAIQCSYGSQRNTSLPSCDAGNGTYASATKLSQTTRYFLVAENSGKQDIVFYFEKNFYAADTCQVRGPSFSVGSISPGDMLSALQETASQDSGVTQAISQAIAAGADHL